MSEQIPEGSLYWDKSSENQFQFTDGKWCYRGKVDQFGMPIADAQGDSPSPRHSGKVGV